VIAEAAVNRSVRVPLTSAQFDALVSLVFNWGAGNFFQSELLRRLNAGDYPRSATTALGTSGHSWRGRDVGPPAATAGEADWFGREGIYTLEELAAMGFDTGSIDGQPPPAAPAPTPPAPTVAAAPTAPAETGPGC
jgi:lysozyme